MRVRNMMIAAVMAIVSVGVVPSHAASAYEMGGGGTLTVAAGDPGMPACAPVLQQPPASCGTAVSNTWVFGSLPILSGGALFDTPQAAAYNCAASTITTVGGTDNFRLNWNFDCTRTSGTGHARITGNFNNASAPGVPVFRGCFKAGSATAEQYDCAGSSGRTVPAVCSGALEPVAFAGSPPRITQVIFEGECSAAG